MLQHIQHVIIQGSNSLPMSTDITYFKNNVRKPVIIYIHGFNGFKDWGNFNLIATKFAEEGYFFIKSNLSHNGTSPEHEEEFVDLEAYGHNNYSKEIFDTVQLINWVKNQASVYSNDIDDQKIILLGHSRGGGISILAAAQSKEVKALITWASVAACKTPWGNWSEDKIKEWQINGVEYYANKRTNKAMPLYYQLYQDYESNSQKLNIEQAISNLHIPIQICHGTKDEAVPVEQAYLLHRSQASSELYLLDSNHVFGRSHPWTSDTLPEATLEVIRANIQFLKKNNF